MAKKPRAAQVKIEKPKRELLRDRIDILIAHFEKPDVKAAIDKKAKETFIWLKRNKERRNQAENRFVPWWPMPSPTNDKYLLRNRKQQLLFTAYGNGLWWMIEELITDDHILANEQHDFATALLAYLYVDKDVDDTTGGLDWSGGALVTAGLGLATWALTEGSGRAWSPSAFVVLGAGLILSLLFLFAERRLGDKAMMPLSLFGSRSFVGLTLLTLLLYGALGGLFVLVPYVLIQAGGYTATQAGAALLPLPLVIAAASPAAGALTAKVGPRSLLMTGPVIVAVGFLLTLRIGPATSYWLGVFPAMVVIAFGMACAVAPLTTAVLMSVDSGHTGAASGLNSAVARTGGLVATALLGPVIASSGPALLSAFGVAAAIGAVICLVAAASAATLIAPAGKTRPTVQR